MSLFENKLTLRLRRLAECSLDFESEEDEEEEEDDRRLAEFDEELEEPRRNLAGGDMLFLEAAEEEDERDLDRLDLLLLLAGDFLSTGDLELKYI
jgi:hypothetical protein